MFLHFCFPSFSFPHLYVSLSFLSYLLDCCCGIF
nr:MAG TPA: hypothetical protein [Caudoviricetes sp.]